MALEGVTHFGLVTAVRQILKGALGHTFFPSPPELRMQCDEAMKAPRAEAERMARERRIREEQQSFKQVIHTPEEKARVSEIYARFLRDRGDIANSEDLALIRAKYGSKMDEIPDAKTNFKHLKAG